MSGHEESLSHRDYTRLCDLVYAESGIHLGEGKRIMLEARIKRRLKALQMESYKQYCEYLFDHKGMREEIVSLIDVVTTNKTDFFRESAHFDFLTQKMLPEWSAQSTEFRPFLIWSAGCSTGEEPYTMAIVLSEYAASHPGFRFRIQASDISTQVLQKARQGIYTEDTIAPVLKELRHRYFLRSRDRENPRVRVVPELRGLVELRRLNFMDSDYGVTEKQDAIFCRNVLIYFDRPTQQQILSKLVNCLRPGGYLFVGHAESLHDMDLPVSPVAPALYRRFYGDR